MYTPSYAFQIGAVTVNRDGTVSSDDEDALAAITPMLMERGWLNSLPDFGAEMPNTAADDGALATIPLEPSEANTPPDEPNTGGDSEADGIDRTCIRIHEPGWEMYSMRNLIRILYTRQYLINRMLKMDQLYIDPEVITLMDDSTFLCVSDLETMIHDETRIGMVRGFNISGGTVEVVIPDHAEGDPRWIFYTQLITAIIKQAKASKRAKAEKMEPANDKYMANAWLNRLGFGGADSKALRRAFMAHLNGYAAFKDDGRMQRHKDKLAEKRKIKREMNEEAHSDD